MNEKIECVVCFQRYSRCERVPRMLHCNHTFCVPCLDYMCMKDSVICTVSCPLCRWITCTRSSGGLSGSLWVNTEIWDMIGDSPRDEEETVEECFVHVPTDKTQTQPICCVTRRSNLKTKLQKVLKIFSCAAVRDFQ